MTKWNTSRQKTCGEWYQMQVKSQNPIEKFWSSELCFGDDALVQTSNSDAMTWEFVGMWPNHATDNVTHFLPFMEKNLLLTMEINKNIIPHIHTLAGWCNKDCSHVNMNDNLLPLSCLRKALIIFVSRYTFWFPLQKLWYVVIAFSIDHSKSYSVTNISLKSTR